MPELPRTDLDLRDVPMALAEEEMCRKLADRWYHEDGVLFANTVAHKVALQFGTGPRADVIASFVWRRIDFLVAEEEWGTP